jgi:hypothetical protein
MVGLMNVAVIALLVFTAASTIVQIGLLVYLIKNRNKAKAE